MTSKGTRSLLYKEHVCKKKTKWLKRTLGKTWGKCKFSPVKRAPWAWPSEKVREKELSPQGFQGRCLPGGGSGFREASRQDVVGAPGRAPGRKRLFLGWKRVFWQGGVGEDWVECKARGWDYQKGLVPGGACILGGYRKFMESLSHL